MEYLQGGGSGNKEKQVLLGVERRFCALGRITQNMTIVIVLIHSALGTLNAVWRCSHQHFSPTKSGLSLTVTVTVTVTLALLWAIAQSPNSFGSGISDSLQQSLARQTTGV